MNDETHFKFILSVQTKNRCSTYLSQVLAHQRTIHLRPFSPQFTFRETKHCNANQHTHTQSMPDALRWRMHAPKQILFLLLLGKCQITKFPTQNTDFPLTQKHPSKDSPPSTSTQTFCQFLGGVRSGTTNLLKIVWIHRTFLQWNILQVRSAKRQRKGL